MKRKRNKRKKIITKIFFVFFIPILFLASLLLFFLNSTKTIIINPLALKNTRQLESLNKTLTAKNIYFSTIEQNNDLSYKVQIKDNGIVYISQKKDLILQIDSLQLIINRLTIEGKRFKSLDFRFDKPVILY